MKYNSFSELFFESNSKNFPNSSIRIINIPFLVFKLSYLSFKLFNKDFIFLSLLVNSTASAILSKSDLYSPTIFMNIFFECGKFFIL